MDDTQINPLFPQESFFPSNRALLSPVKKKYSKFLKNTLRPKKSKKYSIIRRDLRKKSESNHALLSSTLATFLTDNKGVFGRFLLFFVKKSKQYLLDIRRDLE